MKSKFIWGAIALSAGIALTGRAFAQANVIEDEPVTIYVNDQTGSDSNPGSSSQPVATIQQGINLAMVQVRNAIGADVLIAPGVYREAISVPAVWTGAALTVQAQTSGTVYVDAADVLTNGSPTGSGAYIYPWIDTVGGCTLPPGWITGMPPVVLANEMVFINGSHLSQVMSTSQLIPGTFYVNALAQEVEIYPTSGTNMATAQVIISDRRSTLTAIAAENVVFRGLVLQHAASCMNTDGANVSSSSNILFDHMQFRWNNWGAFGINVSSNITVQNSTMSYNGGLGFMGYQIQYGLFSNDEADYNNWRGEMVGFYDFAQGGFKFGRARNVTINGFRGYNNQAEGLWFDTDDESVTVNNSVLVGNATENLKLEANEGPITVTGNTLCSGGVGVMLMDSANVSLSNNYLYGNQSAGNIQTFGYLTTAQNGQVYLAGAQGGRSYLNSQTGAWVTTENRNLTFTNNTFVDSGSGQYLFNTYLSGYDWTDFLDSFYSTGNTWYDSSNSNSFRVPNGQTTSFGGWQNYTGQDYTSQWLSQNYSTACGVPAPVYPDFALLARNAVNFIQSYTMVNGALTIPLQVKSFGFGPVHLSARGLPQGVNAAFSSSSLVSGSSILTLTASSTAAAQRVPITIFGTAPNRTHSLTLWVKVNPI